MSIKFKSFHDYTATHQNPGMFGTTCTETIFATKQAEEFLIEKNITAYNINDIKFSVDSKGNEHILLVYDEVSEE
jgi:hypothetical protein